MNSDQLISVGVFAIVAVIVGLLALHLRHVKTAILLVVAGVCGLGYVTVTITLRPQWSANEIALLHYSLEADKSIRDLRSLPKYDDPKRLTRHNARCYSHGVSSPAAGSICIRGEP